jgi:hypothetical protein
VSAAKPPLIYAQPAALAAWRGTRPLENVVVEAIYAGRKLKRDLPGLRPLGPDERVVFLPDGIVALVRRGRGRIDSKRKTWEVLALRRLSTKNRRH